MGLVQMAANIMCNVLQSVFTKKNDMPRSDFVLMQPLNAFTKA